MKLGLLAILLVISSVGPTLAFRQLSGELVELASGTPIDDDLVASGNTVIMAADVKGSAFLAGSTISATGPVTGSLAVAGGNVTVGGPKQAVMAAGGTVEMHGLSARNLAAAGGKVTVDSESKIARDALIAGNQVDFSGTAGGNLRASADQVSINGRVNGDVYANGRMVSLGPKAIIEGNLVYASPNRVSLANGAHIGGRIEQQPFRGRHGSRVVGRLLRAIFSFAAMFLFGAVLIALFGGWAGDTATRVIGTPGWSALWGLISLILTPIAAVIVILTLIGAPVGVAVILAYIIALMVAAVISALALGRLILRGDSIWLHLLIGLLVICALWVTPFLGGLVRLLVLVFGLGAMAISFRESRGRGSGEAVSR